MVPKWRLASQRLRYFTLFILKLRASSKSQIDSNWRTAQWSLALSQQSTISWRPQLRRRVTAHWGCCRLVTNDRRIKKESSSQHLPDLLRRFTGHGVSSAVFIPVRGVLLWLRFILKARWQEMPIYYYHYRVRSEAVMALVRHKWYARTLRYDGCLFFFWNSSCTW